MLSSELQTRVLDNLTTAVLLLDSDLKLTYINTAGEVLLAVSERQLLGLKVTDLYDELSDNHVEKLQQAIDTDRSFTKRKTKLALHHRETITVNYTVTPITQGDQQLLLIELSPIDRLLRISKEEAFLSSQKTNQILTRGLAHEVKNPLGGIRGAAQLLARELPNEELKDYTNIIIEEADRLRNLVDRMLGPRKALKFRSVNIHEILEHVKSLISAESSGSLYIIRDYDPSIPELMGDPEQLIQALLNVMRNAMQALLSDPDNEAKKITITSRCIRRFTIGDQLHPLVCRIDITDNGPGIPPELAENIFFPMVSGRAEGSGIGLSLSQTIINQHHGLIECDSKPGQTKFSLFLPLGLTHEYQ